MAICQWKIANLLGLLHSYFFHGRSGFFPMHPPPDTQGLSHASQVTSEALPYWCILPLMHKVSHTQGALETVHHGYGASFP
jgi:hypothetical protein